MLIYTEIEYENPMIGTIREQVPMLKLDLDHQWRTARRREFERRCWAAVGAAGAVMMASALFGLAGAAWGLFP